MHFNCPLGLGSPSESEYMQLRLTAWSRVPVLIWNPQVHSSVHNSLPLDPIVSQMNPAETPSFSVSYLNIMEHVTFLFPTPKDIPKRTQYSCQYIRWPWLLKWSTSVAAEFLGAFRILLSVSVRVTTLRNAAVLTVQSVTAVTITCVESQGQLPPCFSHLLQ